MAAGAFHGDAQDKDGLARRWKFRGTRPYSWPGVLLLAGYQSPHTTKLYNCTVLGNRRLPAEADGCRLYQGRSVSAQYRPT